MAQTAADSSQEERDPDALPEPLERLGLSAKQTERIRALLDELDQDLGPAKERRDAFRAAMISATARCSADDSRLHIEANRMVEVGQSARPFVLDAVNELHGILDAKQRAELVDPVLNGERGFGEDTQSGREEGLGKLAEALDLDLIQKLQLVKRAVSRLTISTSETSALRDQAIEAATAFKKDDFDIRKHAIAEAPVVKLYARFVLDMAQVVLPVLSEEQCVVAGGLLRRVFKRNKSTRRRPASSPPSS